MKKYFYTALIASTILAGASSLTVQATKPTTEQAANSEEETADVEKQDTDQTAEPAAVVSDSTAEETAPKTVDMTISSELQKQTLEKFATLSCNLEPTKEFKAISQLHSLEEFGNPNSNDALKTLTLFHAPNPEYMPRIDGLPIISATGVPFINASCVPSRDDCRYILAANPIKGLVEWRGHSINTYPEYIKLLLQCRPHFIISLVSNIQPTRKDPYVTIDPEEYHDADFSLTRSNFISQTDVISHCNLCLYKSGDPKPLIEMNKYYILCEEGNNPTSSQDIVDLILQIKGKNPTDLPIIIQSTSGNGRPSCLATMFLAYDEMTKTDLTSAKNIFEILSDLSQIRCCTEPYFSKEQYLLIYNVVNKLAHQIPYTPVIHNFLIHHNLDAPSDAQTRCVICLENFSDDDLNDRRIFPNCGHFYHRSCCNLSNGTQIMSCPLCRIVY